MNPLTPGRYRVTHSAAGGPIMRGWWSSEATARSKLRSWIGEHGRPGARFDLVDEETGETLAAWPDEPQSRTS